MVQNESDRSDFSVIQPSPDVVQVVLANGISVEVQSNPRLQYQYLSVRVNLPSAFGGLTTGLFGNFNGNISDEFIFRNGTMLSNQATDAEVHEFSQSCKDYINAHCIVMKHDYNTGGVQDSVISSILVLIY